ncbi:MAG: tail fiber domain-containing protein [Bacteroidia bacterium]
MELITKICKAVSKAIFIVASIIYILSFNVNAQNVGIGASSFTPDAQSILDVQSTSRGILIPRMTDVQRIAVSPTIGSDFGMLVYQTNTVSTANAAGYWYWDGAAWVSVTGGLDWRLNGNAGTNASTNFIGTTDANDFVMRTANAERARIESGGNFGIGTTNPTNTLSVGTGSTSKLNITGADGDVTFTDQQGSIIFPTITASGNPAMLYMFNGASVNSRMVIGHSLSIPNRGLLYDDATDKFEITPDGGATTKLSVSAISTTNIVGIGTNSPTKMLSVAAGMNVDDNDANSGTTTNTITFGLNSAEAIGSKRTSGGNQWGLDFYTMGLNRMCVTNDGVVGIGTTSPTATRLQVYDPTTATSRVAIFKNNSALGTEVQVGSIEYLHDYSSTTDFNNGVNSVGLSINLGASTSYDLQVATNSAGKPTNASWTVVSDKRLKEDVHSFKEGLEVLRKINPVYFKYNGKAKTPCEYGIGVIAQDMKEVAPYTVGTFEYLPDENNINSVEQYYNYNPDALHYISLNAIKELDEKQNKMEAVIKNINDFGIATLNDEQTRINFDNDFIANIKDGSQPVVTITSVNSNVLLTIILQDANGFVVKINQDSQPVQINWIAMAKVKEHSFENQKNYTENERQEMLSKVKLPDLSLRNRHNIEMEAIKQQNASTLIPVKN